MSEGATTGATRLIMVVQTARDAAKVRFDERGPRAVRDAGLPHRRGADARLHERGGAAAHARDAGDPLLQPLARRDLAQGRDLGQRPARAPAPLRLRRRRARRPGRPGRPGCHTGERSCFYRDLEGTADPGVDAPRRRRRAGARCPTRRWPSLERTLLDRQRSAPRAATRSSCSTTRGAIGDKVREEADGGRQGRAARSPTSGSPRRPPTSSTTSRCCCSRAASRWPRCWSPERAE